MTVRVRTGNIQLPTRFKQYAVDEHTLQEYVDGLQKRINELAIGEQQLNAFTGAINKLHSLPDDTELLIDGEYISKADVIAKYNTVINELPDMLSGMRTSLADAQSLINGGLSIDVDEELLIDLTNVYNIIRSMQGGQQ